MNILYLDQIAIINFTIISLKFILMLTLIFNKFHDAI